MNFIQQTLAKIQTRVRRQTSHGIKRIRALLGRTPNMDPDVGARLAAFEATGLRVDPRELIDLDTGDVLEGRAFRKDIEQGLPPENALQTMIYDAQIAQAKRRRRHYAGFEHTLAREMGRATLVVAGKESAEVRETRLELLLEHAQSSYRKESHALIYFRFFGTARRSREELLAAAALLRRWPQLEQ